jgi:hypothetical protein
MGKIGVLVALVGLATSLAPARAGEYEEGVLSFQREREARLRAEGGWLSVAGLFWLKDGANRFGTATTNEIVLPEGSTAPEAGVFVLEKGKTTLRLAEGVEARFGTTFSSSRGVGAWASVCETRRAPTARTSPASPGILSRPPGASRPGSSPTTLPEACGLPPSSGPPRP